MSPIPSPVVVVFEASNALNASSESVSFRHLTTCDATAAWFAALVAVKVTSLLTRTVTLPEASIVAAFVSDEFHVTSCETSAGATLAYSLPELTMASSPESVTTGISEAAFVYVRQGVSFRS